MQITKKITPRKRSYQVIQHALIFSLARFEGPLKTSKLLHILYSCIHSPFSSSPIPSLLSSIRSSDSHTFLETHHTLHLQLCAHLFPKRNMILWLGRKVKMVIWYLRKIVERSLLHMMRMEEAQMKLLNYQDLPLNQLDCH